MLSCMHYVSTGWSSRTSFMRAVVTSSIHSHLHSSVTRRNEMLESVSPGVLRTLCGFFCLDHHRDKCRCSTLSGKELKGISFDSFIWINIRRGWSLRSVVHFYT